jgi:hypothetical protein
MRTGILWTVILAISLAIPVVALAEDRVVFGGSTRVLQDEVVDGDLVVFGGSATVAGRVTGDAVVFGGKIVLEESGTVEGDLVALGGSVDRRGTVGGQATSLGGDGQDVLSQEISQEVEAALAEAMGDVVDVQDVADVADTDVVVHHQQVAHVEMDDHRDHKKGKGFWATISSFRHYLRIAYMALIGILILLEFSPERILNITRTVELRPGRSLLAGLLTMTAFVLVMTLLGISIVGIPVAALIYLVLWVIAFPGVMGMCGVFARKLPLGRISGSTGAWLLGALVLMILPFVDWIGPFLFNVLFALGLGAAVLSRFGIREPSV